MKGERVEKSVNTGLRESNLKVLQKGQGKGEGGRGQGRRERIKREKKRGKRNV